MYIEICNFCFIAVTNYCVNLVNQTLFWGGAYRLEIISSDMDACSLNKYRPGERAWLTKRLMCNARAPYVEGYCLHMHMYTTVADSSMITPRER